MKKFFKFLFIFLLVIIVSVSGLAAYLFFSINDGTDNTPESIKQKNYKVEQVINRELANDLSSTNEDIKINLTGEAINEIIYACVKDIKLAPLEMKGAYSYFDDNYNLCVEIPFKLSFINTCLKLKLSLTYKDDVLTFKILDGKVGNLSIANFLVKMGINISNVKSSLNSALEKENLSMNIDLDNYVITITKDQMIQLIDEKLKGDENSSLYSMLARLCLDKNELVEFNLGKEKALGFTIKTSNMKYVASRDGDIEYTIDYNSLLSLMNPDLNTKINYSNVSPVLNYYVLGYQNLEAKDKQTISSLGYSTTYSGIKPSSASTMKNIILDQEPSASALVQIAHDKKYSIKINENQFNSIFSSMDFIGKSFAFASDTKIGYFSIESMYINIEDNAFKLSIILNINNKRVIINAGFTSEKSNSVKIDATLSSLSIGSVNIESTYFPYVLNYLGSILKDEEWINVSDTKISIDLESILNTGSIFSGAILGQQKKELSFKSSADSNGILELSYIFE